MWSQPSLRSPGTFAGLAVGDGLAEVAVEAFLAVVAVPSRRVVPAVQADAAALAPRQLVELHVEAAPPGMEVAVTGCERQRAETISICARSQRCHPMGDRVPGAGHPGGPAQGAPPYGGVTGWDALVAPLARGSQLLAHTPSLIRVMW